MAVLGIDDTDSATAGMCTTYIGTLIAERLAPTCAETFLVRLNPAIPYKTRGNGAVGIRTDASLDDALEVAIDVVTSHARMDDPETNPGVVAVPDERVEPAVTRFAGRAIREVCEISEAAALHEACDAIALGWGNRRGLVGATAAVGAVFAFYDGDGSTNRFDDWTYEYLAYRTPARWGTERTVDAASVHAATAAAGASVWDNVDGETGELACVPHSPCPVLLGIRGDDPDVVAAVGDEIVAEPSPRGRVFVTNQGTDAQFRPATIGRLRDGGAYRVVGTVQADPADRRGGHVFLRIDDGIASIGCIAFEPTKRFRERVRLLRRGDRIVACGEVGRGTLKLEKFAVVDLVRTERTTPTCPECARTMASAGRGQGYRCRACETEAPDKVRRPLDRGLELTWYEVPPTARRHLTKPLARGRAISDVLVES